MQAAAVMDLHALGLPLVDVHRMCCCACCCGGEWERHMLRCMAAHERAHDHMQWSEAHASMLHGVDLCLSRLDHGLPKVSLRISGPGGSVPRCFRCVCCTSPLLQVPHTHLEKDSLLRSHGVCTSTDDQGDQCQPAPRDASPAQGALKGQL